MQTNVIASSYEFLAFKGIPLTVTKTLNFKL